MTREQAVRRLTKLFGAKAYWRVGNEITSPEKRAAARADADRLRADAAAIDAEVKQRMIDTGIQARIDEARAIRKRASDRIGYALHYRFHVGKVGSMFAEILGEGDTWEEAIEKAEAKTR